MRLFKNAFALALAAAAVGSLAACDSGEDNLDFELGSTLTIVGESDIELRPSIDIDTTVTVTADDTTYALNRASLVITPDAVEEGYYVQAFTTNRQYAWTYQGSAVSASCTGSNYPCLRVRSSAGGSYTGEYLDVLYTQRGDYTGTVAERQYDGTFTATVTEPAEISACIASDPTPLSGEAISIDGITAGPDIPTTITVDYGDGSDPATVTALPVTHTYSKAGEYVAAITAENADGEDSCTIPVTVRDPAAVVN